MPLLLLAVVAVVVAVVVGEGGGACVEGARLGQQKVGMVMGEVMMPMTMVTIMMVMIVQEQDEVEVAMMMCLDLAVSDVVVPTPATVPGTLTQGEVVSMLSLAYVCYGVVDLARFSCGMLPLSLTSTRCRRKLHHMCCTW